MSDIAMIVAEEYERRIKNSRKNGDQETSLFSCVSILIKKLDVESFGFIKNVQISEALNPRTLFAVEAFNGSFSA
jgi:hypothetical protein